MCACSHTRGWGIQANHLSITDPPLHRGHVQRDEQPLPRNSEDNGNPPHGRWTDTQSVG